MRPIQDIHTAAQRYFVRGQLEKRARADAQKLRRTVKNDARLLKPTLVRCLKPFCVQGQPVPIGTRRKI